ncbi:MAG: hypothetical protein LUC91_06750 [Prevotella sp.]|nr:hypothetical protein [Prevotella sp.]
MEQKNCLKMVYKIHSKELKTAKWNLKRPLSLAMESYPESIVSIGDSQVLRFIDELNGVTNVNDKVREIQKKIRVAKSRPRTRETKKLIKEYYNALYNLQFIKDYVSVIMDSPSDYDKVNKGFSIDFGDGKIIHYRRFLGTNGGIKTSTIVYVNENLYPELKKRLDNGRNLEMPLVPAKLEAYQALVCSGSVPLPKPKGFIVVNDCITHFKEKVIMLNDEAEGEPEMSVIEDFEVEHDDSDGYGLMSPEYAKTINAFFGGDPEQPLSGINTRYAWTKGMVYTFDFVDFAERIAGTYMIRDAWGDLRDIREADIILTVSMLKLWDSYSSWEDYYENCERNHYQFSTPKITPDILENVRNTNYQFLQSYDFTDEELEELCKPTIDEIKGVLGMDWRKSLVFLLGYSLNEDNVTSVDDNYIKALMIDKRMINDPYVRKSIYSMIKKRIEIAKKGSVKINANYAMISGDPYALCQSMFGLEVTGLLKAGEIYHKYWIDKGSTELACFRAPMTCHNNIRKMKLVNNEDTAYWYQHIKTAIIFNAWDTACDAMNGADKDGDTNMDTDNPIIVKKTLNSPTIMCVQRKADKKIVTEEDIIAANKLAFNDDIGVVTNHVTSMIERQAGYEPDSIEYKTLAYRIMCGQLYQQNTIDRAKGIIAKPMPDYWYDYSKNRVKDTDDEQTTNTKRFNQTIVAANKPYFMIYVYPQLKHKLQTYIKNNVSDMQTSFAKYRLEDIEHLRNYKRKTRKMQDFLHFYDKGFCVGQNPCVVNRICWIFEREFPGYSPTIPDGEPFDYTILKSGTTYSKNDHESILALYEDYKIELERYQQRVRSYGYTDDLKDQARDDFTRRFVKKAREICPNEQELCDIVLDICYQRESTKQFAWDVAGDVIIENLLRRNDHKISFPSHSGSEFEYCGEMFEMKTIDVQEEDIVDNFE